MVCILFFYVYSTLYTNYSDFYYATLHIVYVIYIQYNNIRNLIHDFMEIEKMINTNKEVGFYTNVFEDAIALYHAYGDIIHIKDNEYDVSFDYGDWN